MVTNGSQMMKAKKMLKKFLRRQKSMSMWEIRDLTKIAEAKQIIEDPDSTLPDLILLSEDKNKPNID